MDMKNVTDKNCTVMLDGDELIKRNQTSNKTVIKQKTMNGLYPVRLDDSLQLEDEFTGIDAEACVE